MLLLRIELPDAPGSLGAVASAMGTVGADIKAVEIVEKRGDLAVDDFMVELPPTVMKDSLVSACAQLEHVHVLWLSNYPDVWGLESDLELLNRMADDPEQAAEVLTQSAPRVFHCHWAVLLDRLALAPTFATSQAPDLTAEELSLVEPLDSAHSTQLDDGWLPNWGEAAVAIAPLAGDRAILLGRQGGPHWLRSELQRLQFLSSTV